MPGKVQTIGARFAYGKITLEEAAEAGLPRVRIARRRLPIPGHRRDLASSGEALGLTLDACRTGAFGTTGMAGYGAAQCARACCG